MTKQTSATRDDLKTFVGSYLGYVDWPACRNQYDDDGRPLNSPSLIVLDGTYDVGQLRKIVEFMEKHGALPMMERDDGDE